MIFAAGKGTRLKPITDTIPKALVEVAHIPMLQHTIQNLIVAGVSEIIINVHYLAPKILEFLKMNNNFGITIHISDESDELLETGGGLLKAKDFLKDSIPFFLCNVDVFTNIDYKKLYNSHLKNNAIATLAVRKRDSSRVLLFNSNNRLCGWKNILTQKSIIPIPSDDLSSFAFSGIHVIDPNIFDTCKREGVFSMIDWYLDICANHVIKSYLHDYDIWIDVGTTEALEKANRIAQ